MLTVSEESVQNQSFSKFDTIWEHIAHTTTKAREIGLKREVLSTFVNKLCMFDKLRHLSTWSQDVWLLQLKKYSRVVLSVRKVKKLYLLRDQTEWKLYVCMGTGFTCTTRCVCTRWDQWVKWNRTTACAHKYTDQPSEWKREKRVPSRERDEESTNSDSLPYLEFNTTRKSLGVEPSLSARSATAYAYAPAYTLPLNSAAAGDRELRVSPDITRLTLRTYSHYS